MQDALYAMPVVLHSVLGRATHFEKGCLRVQNWFRVAIQMIPALAAREPSVPPLLEDIKVGKGNLVQLK